MTNQSVTSLERTGAEIINLYLFNKVWNEPVSEYRSNIQPAKFTKRTVVGTFRTAEGYLELPTDREAYLVWTIGTDELGFKINIPNATWVDTATCVNDYRVKFDFYDIHGKMFHKSGVFVRYNSDGRILYFAAKKDMLYICTDLNTLDRNEVYITTYFDSDAVNKITTLSFKASSVDSSNMDYQLKMDILLAAARPDTVLIYKNGVEITQGGSPSLTHGDWFDIIVDENIVFAFDVDLVTKHESPAYLSTRDSTWKQLIHIPKILNPENHLYTHDTCDFYIRRAQGVTPYGLYMHRIAENAVVQVTHNDFGVPLIVIDAYRDYLYEQEITMHVVVRRHDKDNVLIPDASYIYLLYADVHDDDRIIDILCGLGPANIPWWKAAELEQSLYVQMMFDTPNTMTINRDLMDTYIETLGYYHVVNLLCPRILDTTLENNTNHTFVISKPMAYAGYDVVPLLYLNGKHLAFNQYQYTNTEDDALYIVLDSNIVIRDNDILTTVFCLSSNNKCCVFTLDESNLVIELPYTDPIVYEKVENANRETIAGSNASYTHAYVERHSGDNIYGYRDNGDGTSTLVFNNQYIGGVFAIQNRYATYILSYDLTDMVLSGQNLTINLTQQDEDTLQQAPILNLENTVVYYNNKYLVKGIDYHVNVLKDKEDRICNTELVIQTMDHYTDETNQVDILVNQDLVRDNSNGFVINNKLYDESPVNLMFRDITLTHVDGMAERDVTNYGNYMIVPEDKYSTGQIWEIQTAIPRLIIDFIAKYSDKNDNERLAIMNEYFSTQPDPDPEVLLVDGKNRIYSTFLNKIIQLTLEGSIAVTIDPDQARLDTALSEFDQIKNADIVYSGLDQRFVDYYPQFINAEIDAVHKPIIDYLVNHYLPNNLYPSLHSVAEECD